MFGGEETWKGDGCSDALLAGNLSRAALAWALGSLSCHACAQSTPALARWASRQAKHWPGLALRHRWRACARLLGQKGPVTTPAGFAAPLPRKAAQSSPCRFCRVGLPPRLLLLLLGAHPRPRAHDGPQRPNPGVRGWTPAQEAGTHRLGIHGFSYPPDTGMPTEAGLVAPLNGFPPRGATSVLVRTLQPCSFPQPRLGAPREAPLRSRHQLIQGTHCHMVWWGEEAGSSWLRRLQQEARPVNSRPPRRAHEAFALRGHPGSGFHWLPASHCWPL